ncbi:MAG: hybrid sensor histidine kinase/response regulator [Chthoniobacteraceae bacterium]|nr:hybrid sensor histidine kinase/response regulator [Chthoniobacteraceae bacterium]
MSSNDFSQFSLLDLFHQEAENQAAALTRGLLALERAPADSARLEELMRAAHSLKGAARIVGLDAAVQVAHAMEDCFVAAQKGRIVLSAEAVDVLLKSVDLFGRIAQTPEQQFDIWKRENAGEIEQAVASVNALSVSSAAPPPAAETAEPVPAPKRPEPSPAPAEPVPSPAASPKAAGDRVLRVAAESLNRLLGLAGEALVESRWMTPYAASLLRLKRQQAKLSSTLEALRESLTGRNLDEQTLSRLADAQRQAAACVRALGDRHGELELSARRSASLAHRLYREALASRMRPFADGIQGFHRVVRDLARSLGKEVQLRIAGESTPVDRDVLERLEAPLGHLLRNAVDHGMETPQERIRAGKPREGSLRLEARHASGLLSIVIEDDGRGIDLENLRRAVVAKKYTTAEVAQTLSEEELVDFLFLPGFSLRDQVTEISGRGVGLDVVQNMVKSVGGSVRVVNQPGLGVRLQIQLPLTLSVMRFLLVEVAGEPYAIPLARLARTLQVGRGEIEVLEGREHVPFEGQRVGLVSAAQIFGKNRAGASEELAVVILGDRAKRFGVVVDRFLGEQQLVVAPLDPRLGKIKDINAGALMPDGTPVLILDVDDLVRSVELLVSGGRLDRVQPLETQAAGGRRKRVLVVDDSLTVRELERKLIGNAGYEVEVSIDGMDGWNAVRTQPFDLVVTDIDMPRLDGIELVRLIKNDPRLKTLPVMIVSYKDRPEDRSRGLEAGADYYLTKGSFHDETLLNGVQDLIGEAQSPAESQVL